MTLEGRVALITGAGGEHGFGRAIARRLARDGADVAVTDVAPRGTRVVASKPESGWRGLEDVAAEVEKEGRRALALTLDVDPRLRSTRRSPARSRLSGGSTSSSTMPPRRPAPTGCVSSS